MDSEEGKNFDFIGFWYSNWIDEEGDDLASEVDLLCPSNDPRSLSCPTEKNNPRSLSCPSVGNEPKFLLCN